MPRVSEEHRVARRQQIIDAAHRCIVENGFHQTSMQDVINESGLSAGAVYRYFTGKEELIRAVAEKASVHFAEAMAKVVSEHPTLSWDQALARLLSGLMSDLDESRAGTARLAVQIWGEAQRDPVVAEAALGALVAAQRRMHSLVVQLQDTGRIPKSGDAGQISQALLSFLLGCIVQSMLMEDVDLEGLAHGLAALPSPVELERAGG